ncbi:MAG TPA: hypothetical protein VK489_11920 [Ferruginibacter sp.]|nr:hypothetical protein [Ferruginibacter sp.]
MKIFVAAFLIILSFDSPAQSPGLRIDVWMDPVKAGSVRYKIEMKICEPRKMTNRGDWFAHDTSVIDFGSLKPADINCDAYFNDAASTIVPADEDQLFNHFEFNNQVFAWEKILVFRISNPSSSSMFIIIPMRYKSFRTTINIKDVVFQPGKVIFLTDIKGRYDRKKLSFNRSLKKVRAVELKSFSLKGIL